MAPAAIWHVTLRLSQIDPNNPPNMAPQVAYFLALFLLGKNSLTVGLLELLVSTLYAPLKINCWFWLSLGATSSLYYAGSFIHHTAPSVIDMNIHQYIAILFVALLYGATWKRRQL